MGGSISIEPEEDYLWQIGGAFLFLAYAGTSFLLMRLMLIVASIFYIIWSTTVLEHIALDLLLWWSGFLLINLVHASILIFQTREPDFEGDRHASMFTHIFEPMGFSRTDFKELAEIGLSKNIKKEEYYLHEDGEVHNLTLILRGAMELTKESYRDGIKIERVINTVGKYDFVESTDWLSRYERRRQQPEQEKGLLNLKMKNINFLADSSDVELMVDTFQKAEVSGVNAKATEDCTFFVWPVERLEQFLRDNPHRDMAVNSLLGLDVARRVFRQNAQKESWDKELEKEAKKLKKKLDRKNKMSKAKHAFSNQERGIVTAFKPHSSMSDEEFHKLFDLGEWRECNLAGTTLATQGETCYILGILRTGMLTVSRTETDRVTTIRPLQFISSVQFMDSKNRISNVTVTSQGPCSYLVWEADKLREAMADEPNLTNTLSTLLAVDIARKFKETDEAVAPPSRRPSVSGNDAGQPTQSGSAGQLFDESEDEESEDDVGNGLLVDLAIGADAEAVYPPSSPEVSVNSKLDDAAGEDKQEKGWFASWFT